MPYYTKNGDYIWNPKNYAKTGAPMYKDDSSKNINKTHYIYKLNLEDNKKYIGKTTDADRRMEQHFSGNGSKVTQKFNPIKGKIIDKCPGYFANKIENSHTEDYINKYGYKNVRGGYYTNSKSLKKSSYYKDNSNTYYSKKNYYNNYDSDD